MNYTKLKQQPRQGGVPRTNLNQASSAATTPRDAVVSPLTNVATAATTAITDQVRQLAQTLDNQIVA